MLDHGLRIALVGNPNSGKTSLFNALTGSLQRVANHSGVTVSVSEAFFHDTWGKQHRLFDLPGAYSLRPHDPEEVVLQNFLLNVSTRPDRILCIVDANHLEKSLYLVAQVLHLKIPSAIFLTMEESAKQNGLYVSRERLSKYLGVPVLSCRSLALKTMVRVKDFIANDRFKVSPLDFFSLFLKEKMPVEMYGADKTAFEVFLHYISTADIKLPAVSNKSSDWENSFVYEGYKRVDLWCKACIKKIPSKKKYSFDRIFLHPFWGWITLGGVVCSLLSLVFVLSDYVSCSFTAAYLWMGGGLKLLPECWLRDLILEGMLGGVGNLILFLPQLACLMFLIGVLENTGYLARIAFLMDRWMKYFGLSGKSFIPLLSCYSCTIPGLLNSRCIQSYPERFTMMFISPWISCSGRFPIYFLLVSVLFFEKPWWIKTLAVLGIYFCGTLLALFLAKILRKFWFKGGTCEGNFLEVPALKIPQLGYVFKLTYGYVKSFLRRAGSFILLFSVLLWCLLNTPYHGQNKRAVEHTWLANVGRKLDPIFKPIGCDWKAGISLLASFGARENFISTLGVMHNMNSNIDCKPLPALLHSEKTEQGQPRYSIPACLSLIVFFMFSMQCIGTFVFVWRESGLIRFALKQFLITGIFAYGLACLIYNIARLWF